ncbi:MAG: hypothetical protein ABI137_04480 [Antricoccus sp.]
MTRGGDDPGGGTDLDDRVPQYWRLYICGETEEHDGIRLNPGTWVLGFAEEPSSAEHPTYPTIETESADGVLAAFEIQVSDSAWKPMLIPLGVVLSTHARSLLDRHTLPPHRAPERDT